MRGRAAPRLARRTRVPRMGRARVCFTDWRACWAVRRGVLSYEPGRTDRDGQRAQCRILRGSEPLALMALTAVSRPVVVDGDSFLDALFASAGQDRRAMEHRPQDRGSRRRTIDWQLDDRGALEARLGNVFNDLQSCNSNLICSLCM